ncbi:hypothetical protein BgiBS90_004879, partial [Biomphalaria glabrata]
TCSLFTTRSALSTPARSSASTGSAASPNLSPQRLNSTPLCQREGISVVPTTNGPKAQCPLPIVYGPVPDTCPVFSAYCPAYTAQSRLQLSAAQNLLPTT